MYSKKMWGLLGAIILTGCHFQTTEPSQDVISPVATPKVNNQKALSQVDETAVKIKALDFSKPVNFQQAADYVLQHSDKLLAAQTGWQASQLQADSLDLHQPMVMIGGMVGRYNVETDINTAGLTERLDSYKKLLSNPQMLGKLQQIAPNMIGNIAELQKLSSLGIMPEIPSNIHLQKQDNFSNAHLMALLPLYTGGRINAIQEFAQGRADANATEVVTTKEELLKTLIKRYFQVQLAERVVKVREVALKSVKGHSHSAKRMQQLGMISKVQRLQAVAALSDAEFQLDKAKDNLRLAQRALNSLLQGKNINTATTLFVKKHKLAPLSTFQTKAQAHYPIFAQIKAKRKQAKAMEQLSDAAWKPSVAAFGSYQLDKDHNWVVGINARWTLHSSVDRSKIQQAAQMTLRQVDAIYRQVEKDINLLVEKNWLAVDDTRQRYQSLAKEETLAQQVLKLHRAGFKEGINTVIELNDAQAKLVKIQTERANVAYEYVIALAELLESTGNLHTFVDYIPTSLKH
ncbi:MULTISPECIES: TolC family protein [Pasteurellaceae]|uniref:TolC family protein n=1 Tax=Pasteurella atlantica TaxID=2827233 RepID=A0AAW8CTW6_9PAST|nr:TolC family protein [Pasteurella atlantica]MBR0574260.1 TolC family protein [Pasteurella atlantica]MDP8040164.1 TolC family protein [Pasteurella atlantica]MDP8042313.1 TolC family protein [Pasteurella atlantica]MDP8044470.1 TolC family protein [Pasteurella atlantica]MDP8046518.1 TolC family protein [Pasteurella atlantica]